MPAGRGRATWALVGLALLVALAGCTSDDGPDATTTSSTTTTTAGADAQTMRLGIGGDLVVDPVEASLASPQDMMVVDLLYDGLTRMDDAGVPQPALAASWRANADNTAFRFELDREGTFASGRPVTSEDVITSLERIILEGDTSLAALSLEAVTGFRAFAEGEADHVSGLQALTSRTVRFELETPLSVLPEVLSSPLLSVVDAESIEGDLGELDLSGDWAVASSDDDVLTVERREGAPEELAAVELHSYDDDEAAYQAFVATDVDWAGVPTARFQEAVDDYGDGSFAPFQAELFFGMNLSNPNLATAPLRVAIVRAIDREAIVDEVYSELADPLSTIVPLGIVGHDADRCPSCRHDPEEAAQIVELLYPDGKVPTIGIDFDESEAQQEMAEMVAADLEAVGIPTKLRPRPLEEYKEFVVSGRQQLFSFGWIGAYQSPDAYLAPLFGSAANDNLTHYRSLRVDGRLALARLGAPGATNLQRWAIAETDVLEAAVVVPIAQFRTQVVVADQVEGLTHAVDGTVDWTVVRIVD